jgi:hypothetical protein
MRLPGQLGDRRGAGSAEDRAQSRLSEAGAERCLMDGGLHQAEAHLYASWRSSPRRADGGRRQATDAGWSALLNADPTDPQEMHARLVTATQWEHPAGGSKTILIHTMMDQLEVCNSYVSCTQAGMCNLHVTVRNIRT